MISCCKIVTSVLLADSHYWFSPLLTLIKQEAILGRPMWQSTEGNKQSDRNWGWSLANSQQGTKSVSPTGCKELEPDNSHAVWKADLSLVELSDEIPASANPDYRLRRDPKAEHPEHSLLNHALILTLRSSETMNSCYFKVLILCRKR